MWVLCLKNKKGLVEGIAVPLAFIILIIMILISVIFIMIKSSSEPINSRIILTETSVIFKDFLENKVEVSGEKLSIYDSISKYCKTSGCGDLDIKLIEYLNGMGHYVLLTIEDQNKNRLFGYNRGQYTYSYEGSISLEKSKILEINIPTEKGYNKVVMTVMKIKSDKIFGEDLTKKNEDILQELKEPKAVKLIESSEIKCFLEGTSILMGDFGYKNIEDIKEGDEVLSYDFDTVVVKEVTKVLVHPKSDKSYLFINNKIKVTPNHRFYLNGDFKPIGEAKIGDLMLDFNKDGVEVKSIVEVNTEEYFDVYNIEVEDTHNYFAEGYLVHNIK